MSVMERDQTIDFLNGHVKTEMLMKHLLCVEASMRGYAGKFGEDQERWGIAGLLHDFDWEICPTAYVLSLYPLGTNSTRSFSRIGITLG